MTYTQTSPFLFAPEVFLLISILGILLFDAFSKHPKKTPTFVLTLIALLSLILISLVQWAGNHSTTFVTLNGLYIADYLAHFLKTVSCMLTSIALVYGRPYIKTQGMLKNGEVYTLTLFSLLGQMIMISANNFLIIYLGLELMSLSLYALIALYRDNYITTEATVKYFVLGAIASGFLLYGISMIYGATGYIDLCKIRKLELLIGDDQRLALVLGLVFIISGLAFKLGAAPFHMWVPDVYQASPTPVTLVLSTAPKLAVFSVTLRLLITSLQSLLSGWQMILTLIALSSLVIGNLTAIGQSNLKRMLAYSNVAHIGFVLLGLIVGVNGNFSEIMISSYSSSLFYVLTYTLASLGIFGLLSVLSGQGFKYECINDLKGLNRKDPLSALTILILISSLAGLPPSAGFYGKLIVLQSLVNSNFIFLAVTAVLCSLIGAFYYLRIIRIVYFDKPDTNKSSISETPRYRVTLLMNSITLLFLGLFPERLTTACSRAIQMALEI